MNLGILYFYITNMGIITIEDEIIFDKCYNILEYDSMSTQNKFNFTILPHNDYLKLYVYDPVIIFNEYLPIFEYSCRIKSLTH